MKIYSELKQIAEINEKLKSLINELRQKDFDIDGCMFENAYFIRDCIEVNGHLYNKVGERLDTSGLVDNDYYCEQHVGYYEDDYYGTLYFVTDEEGVFVAIPFAM